MEQLYLQHIQLCLWDQLLECLTVLPMMLRHAALLFVYLQVIVLLSETLQTSLYLTSCHPQAVSIHKKFMTFQQLRSIKTYEILEQVDVHICG